MAVSFKIPASPAVQVYENDTFLGVDFTTDIGNVDDNKSPDAVNMIRSIPGKVRKRMGYRKVGAFGSLNEIFGVHYYSYEKIWLIHAGQFLYTFTGSPEKYWIDRVEDMSTSKVVQTEDEYAILFTGSNETPGPPLYSQMAKNKSTSYELNQLLVILDGKKMLYVKRINGTLTCGKMEDYPDLTVPLVRISCSPDGTGTDYQPFNLLTPRFEQDFIIDEDHSETHTLQLYTDKLSNATVEMEVLQDDTTWATQTENTNFTVDRTTGIITLTAVFYPIKTITSYTGHVFIPNSEPFVTRDVTFGFVEINPLNPGAVTFRAILPSGIDNTWDCDIDIKVAASDFNTEINRRYDLTQTDIDNGFILRTMDFTTNLTKDFVPVTPIPGTDNIKVRASYIPTSGNAELINHCRFGILYGINGAGDRLFVSGNPNFGNNVDTDGNVIGTFRLQNRDWYSEQNDPTYFPDTGYSILGADTSAIMGYSIVNSYLATYKDNNELSQTVFIRVGDMVVTSTDEAGNEITIPAFKLVNTLQGAGAISSYCFDYFEVEPIFLSKKGIYALTTQDITGERYAQNRSYFLDAKLLKEHNLNKAVGFTWKDYYVICVNNHFYILDGIQPINTDKDSPYATRQYVSFYFELNPKYDTINNIKENITHIWEMYGQFYFGTDHGDVYRFYTDNKDAKSYSDQGSIIPAWWTTPDIAGKLFYKNKTFRYVALTVPPVKDSSITIEANKHGVWEEIKDDEVTIHIFSFIGLTFARSVLGYLRFSFICDNTQRVIPTKIRVKKVDKLQFRFSNERFNEPMGLNNYALEYTQGGNLK